MCTSCVLPIVKLRRLCPAKSHLCPRLEQTLSSSSFIILTAELSEFGRKHSYFTMSPLQEMRQNHMYTVVLINSRRTISFLTNFCQVISYKSYKRGSSYYVFNQGGGKSNDVSVFVMLKQNSVTWGGTANQGYMKMKCK